MEFDPFWLVALRPEPLLNYGYGMVKFERLSGLWNYRLSRPTGTFFYVFYVFFKIQKNDFLRFLSCLTRFLEHCQKLNLLYLKLHTSCWIKVLILHNIELQKSWHYNFSAIDVKNAQKYLNNTLENVKKRAKSKKNVCEDWITNVNVNYVQPHA